MFVRQLIGREAGNIINMPFTVAESCLAMGTVEKVTDEEITAAGLEVEPIVVNRPAEFPRGFRVEPIPGGFDLYDPGGVNVSNSIELRNLAAARDLAWAIAEPNETEPEPSPFDKLNKADLLKIAEGASVEIAASAKKADIIAALNSAGVTAPSTSDGMQSGEGASGSDDGSSGQDESQSGDGAAATGEGGQISGSENGSGQAE